MKRRRALALSAICLLLVSVGPRASTPSPQFRTAVPIDGRAAVLVVDLASGRPISTQRPDLLAARIAPGPILKIATLITALETGAASRSTQFTCRRHVTAGGRELVCIHPDLGRPLSPAEALSLSCNDFFATTGARLSRDALAFTTASLGLPPISASAPLPLVAVGLAGLEATPEQLLRAFSRAVVPATLRLHPETRQVLAEGLRGARDYGRLEPFRLRGIDALVQTGSVQMPGGGYQAVAFAVAPSAAPTRGVAVLLPGGSEAEATALAAQALASDAGPAGTEPIEAGRPAIATPGEPTGEPPPGSEDAPPPKPIGSTIRIGHADGGGYEVAEIPFEDYVARVVAGEAPPRSAPAALEAMAIAVRTFAVANNGRHRADGFDLCDLTHCQVMAASTAATRQAAEATAGEILLYHGQPASIFYTACCGGESELPEDVWPRAQGQPFLKRHKERECRELSEWTSEIAASDLLRALRGAGCEGPELRNLRVSRRSASGRAASLRVQGLKPEEITGDELRQAVGRSLGWQLLKSTAFDVKKTKRGYRFSGRGYGHGVGLCQIGAARMAAQGRSAANILEEYFPGTTIGDRSAATTDFERTTDYTDLRR